MSRWDQNFEKILSHARLNATCAAMEILVLLIQEGPTFKTVIRRGRVQGLQGNFSLVHGDDVLIRRESITSR